jgi:hypothetical protein
MANPRATILGYATLIVLGDPSLVLSQDSPASSAQSCDTISWARTGRGVAYRGVINNSDYRFSATIPPGSTGWGAGQGAPFHGFTIYLKTNPLESSCIVLEIGTHVVLPEDSPSVSTPLNETRVKVGNRVGIQTSKSGSIHGIRFDNLSLSLELPRADAKVEVSITLVTPTKYMERNKAIFEKFVSQLKFW